MKKKVWLIGAGSMAIDYAKVLKGMNIDFVVVGNGEQSALNFESATGVEVNRGGLSSFIASGVETIPDSAIVAVDAIHLFDACMLLCKLKVKNILLEKPGPLFSKELDLLIDESSLSESRVYIGYNRRFYASVLYLKERLVDNSVASFDFEFTEWIHKIKLEEKSDLEKEKLLLVYSSHLIDLAFFLGGKPKEISAFANNGFDWHSSGGVFAGAGITEKDALFSYKANWKSAGRWSLNIQTNEQRFVLCPLEKLQVQAKGTIKVIEQDGVDYFLDEQYKPGLYLQTKAFLESDDTYLCSLEEQKMMFDIYEKIANY
jgi:predicted dehydrogenase